MSPPKPLLAHVSLLRREVQAKRPVGKRPNATRGLWTHQKQLFRDAPCFRASYSWRVCLITLLEVGDQISGPDSFTVPTPSCVSGKEISYYNSLLGMEAILENHCQHFEITHCLVIQKCRTSILQECPKFALGNICVLKMKCNLRNRKRYIYQFFSMFHFNLRLETIKLFFH